MLLIKEGFGTVFSLHRNTQRTTRDEGKQNNKAESAAQPLERKKNMGKNSAKNIAKQIQNRAASLKEATESINEVPANEVPANEVPANEVPAAPLSLAAALKAQMAALQTQLAALASQEAEAKKAQKVLFADKLAAFLPSVNCANLDEFAELFREYRKGLETGSNSGGKRSKFSAEEKERILNLIRRAKSPDSTPEERVNGQLSAIAKATGIEYQTLRNWAIGANLHTVTARTV